MRSDQAWLQDRSDWLKKLEVLLKREPGWEQAVKDAVVAHREGLDPEYVKIYEHNMGEVFAAIAGLVNSRSEKQDERLRRSLADIREDLGELAAQGLDCPGMKGC
jgi:hypothetical protein